MFSQVLQVTYSLVSYNNLYLPLFSFLFIESPPVFTEHPQSGVVKQFDPTTLRCTVSIEAGQSVQLTWTHNGHHVTHEYGAARGISTSEGILTGSLTIDSFKQRPRDESNVGVYNCVASNSVGTVVSQDAILSKAGEYIEKW